MRSLIRRLVGVAVVLVALALPATAQAQGIGPVVIVRVPPTAVMVPDGGTALVGGVTHVFESRSQFGAPILANVPGVNRAFTNVGYGRSLGIARTTVSVRVISLAEEEFRQTGYRSR